MSSTYGTGQTTAKLTGSVSTGLASPTQTQTIVQKSDTGISITNNTGATLHTVTGGKTLYVSSITIQLYSAPPAGASCLTIRDNTTILQTIGMNTTGLLGQTGTFCRYEFVTPIKISTSLILYNQGTATTVQCFTSFVGWEE
jgi:hypothetical protein